MGRMTSDSPERWRAVIAALLDDDARAVLSDTATHDLTERRRARALERLVNAGVLRYDGDATPVFDHDGIRALLASAPRPTGPERFLDGAGRIDRYPSRDDERHTLLEWVAHRVLTSGEAISEREINERLLPYAPAEDVAVLRRYLVDHELVERTRSGTEYALVDE